MTARPFAPTAARPGSEISNPPRVQRDRPVRAVRSHMRGFGHDIDRGGHIADGKDDRMQVSALLDFDANAALVIRPETRLRDREMVDSGDNVGEYERPAGMGLEFPHLAR